MIKINKNDSIVDIILKIKNCKQDEIILEFPFWHPVLHNYVSLKILKNKSWKKDLVIITNDKTAKKIWKNIWIKYSLINNPDLIQYNYTFFEYLLYTFKSYFREIRDVFLKKNTDIIIKKYNKKYSNSKIWYFISFLFISFILLIFIFYFAVNKTYIYITPEIEVKTKAENFVFIELWDDEVVDYDYQIKLKEVSKEVTLSSSYWTSWVSGNSTSASTWKVLLYNKYNQKIDLLANTRVQDESWIIFTINWPVTLPASVMNTSWVIIPWEVSVNVTSKINDAYWKVSWSRANIKKWIDVFLPWLADDKENIYGITTSDFTWANDDYVKTITQKDIENAKDLMKAKLEAESIKELKDSIQESNNLNDVEYKILWVDWIIRYSNMEITWLENIKINQEMDNFELTWKIKVTSFIYNNEILLNKLKNSIKETVLEEVEEILQINNDSLRIADMIWSDEYPVYSVKATAQIEALYIHNFLNKYNNYVSKLKEIVAWLDKNEAEKILLNYDRISNVDIEIRPFFIKKVSKISDNIILKVLKN